MQHFTFATFGCAYISLFSSSYMRLSTLGSCVSRALKRLPGCFFKSTGLDIFVALYLYRTMLFDNSAVLSMPYKQIVYRDRLRSLFSAFDQSPVIYTLEVVLSTYLFSCDLVPLRLSALVERCCLGADFCSCVFFAIVRNFAQQFSFYNEDVTTNFKGPLGIR